MSGYESADYLSQLGLNRELLQKSYATSPGFKLLHGRAGRGLAKKRIVCALQADRRCFAVAGINNHVVRQNKQLIANRLQDLRKRAAPEIRSSNAPLKKSVAGDQPIRVDRVFVTRLRQAFSDANSAPNNETNASRGVPGSMEHTGFISAPA